MIELGRICMKLAGRDAGGKCVILKVEKNRALVDGQVRRRQCNILHLEPLAQKIEISENASHEDVIAAFKKLGIEVQEKKKKEKPAPAASPNGEKKEKKSSKLKAVKA